MPAKEFILLLTISKDKFYILVNTANIKQPIQLCEENLFWYPSYVKNKVEEHKPESDIVAHI
ncbi:transcriptional regulator [Acinetobacter silvestris]|uniref:Transcriptional regulator n=1 Tax=Acinetobacter silvestris TaxID=1977882 RepID=A0A1Y3CJF1_9GAMM|nr:transcriptional regulator [Acinetobacter silvestris]